MTDWDLITLATRLVGSTCGSVTAIIMVVPEDSRSGFLRILVGVILGAIFAPTMANLLWFLDSEGWDHNLASGAASGFLVWFVLESTVKLLKSGYLDKLIGRGLGGSK